MGGIWFIFDVTLTVPVSRRRPAIYVSWRTTGKVPVGKPHNLVLDRTPQRMRKFKNITFDVADRRNSMSLFSCLQMMLI